MENSDEKNHPPFFKKGKLRQNVEFTKYRKSDLTFYIVPFLEFALKNGTDRADSKNTDTPRKGILTMSMNKDVREKALNTEAQGENKPLVSGAVVKRLPRYFRYLRELLKEGKTRVSSNELAALMHITASQIRQDLNCFGGFGQQGYGYNVNYLYAKISEILGVGKGFQAIIIGAGNLGRALVHSSMFEKRGVDVIAMFDVNPALFGQRIGDVTVYSMDSLEEFCKENQVDIAVLTLPREPAIDVVAKLSALGVPGAWNFTNSRLYDVSGNMTVETVHLGDSLMVLCYEISRRQRESVGIDTDIEPSEES